MPEITRQRQRQDVAVDDLSQSRADGFASGMKLPLGAQPGGPYVPGVCHRGNGCLVCDHLGARMRHDQWLAGFREAQVLRMSGNALNLA